MTENPDNAGNDSSLAESADSSATQTRPARVWTVFGVVVAALVAILIAQMIAGSVLVAVFVAQGMDRQRLSEQLPERLSTPMAFIVLAIFTQLAVALTALIAAQRSPQSTGTRLGLLNPGLPYWSYGVFMIGSLLPLGVGLTAALGIAQVIEPDSSVKALYDKMTPLMAISFVLFISLVPGFVEELFWRGYVQRRLLERWSPWVAILVTSLMFGIFHVTPHAVANALIIGVWLGVLAWKTGSIWPGAACHAFVNGAWNTYQIGERLFGFPATPPTAVSIASGGIVVACFVASVWLISNSRADHDPKRLAAL